MALLVRPLPLSFVFCVAVGTIAVSAELQAQAQTAPAGDTPQPPVQTLERVTIRASADASAGGLTAPYPGGQVARGGRVGILGSQDVMDTPFSTTNYTSELIRNQQAASIGDVLRNDPAVRVARGFGNFQQVYQIRGFPVYSDDMAYNGLYGLLPRQYLAAELVERVEVLRGASAFLNGAAPGGSGLGGAVNVSPKRAPNTPLTDATLGFENGGQRYAAADLARRFGPGGSTGIRITAVRRQGDTAVDGEERELGVFSIGGDWRSGNLRVSADLGWQDHRLTASQPNVTIAAGLPIPAAPDADRGFGQPWTLSNERDRFGTLRAEYDVARDVTAWAAYGARHGDERTDVANPTVVDAAGTTSAFRFVGSRTDRISTGEVGVRAKLQTGSVGHTLVASGATHRAKLDAPYAFSNFAGFAGNLYARVGIAPPAATALTGVTTADGKTTSVAIADTLSLLQDSLLVTLGARQQRIENAAYDERRVTPVAGVVYKPGRMLSLYSTYIEGLVQGETAPATAGNVPVANADEVFAPTRVKQGEVGVKVDTGRLGGSFSVFQSRKPIFGFNASNQRYGPADTQRNRGAELSVFGEAVAGFKLLGGSTFLRTDVTGRDAIGAPKWQFNLGAEWTVPGVAGLSVDARGEYTSSQFADAANTQRVPSWSRLDLGARYGFAVGQQDVTLRLRVNNVTGRDHWASVGGFPGFGYLVVGEPRTVVVSGSVSF